MFLCKRCLGQTHYGGHLAFSYGGCERCKKLEVCADCRCPAKPRKVRAPSRGSTPKNR
jgi:hypothetical protein